MQLAQKSVAYCLCLLLIILVAAPIVASNDAVNWCTGKGDQLNRQQKWQASVQAYKQCSSSHGDTGPVAAWANFQAFHVIYYQLKDTKAAAAACEAGWNAFNAPELAWCAAFCHSYLQNHETAKEWAHKAIDVGCFRGSCQPVISMQPDRSLEVDSCSWEGPYDVLYWAYKGLGDEASAVESDRKKYQAKYARKSYGRYRDLYLKTKEDVTIPRGPALRDPSTCGKRMLPQRPIPAGNYVPQLHVVTFATDLNRKELDELLRSAQAFGVRVTVLQPRFDLHGYWGGRFGLRLQLVTNFANMVPDEDIIMFVDGYDVIFTGNTSSIIEGYYNATQGRDIALFAAETGVWPETDLESSYPPGPTRYKFLNAGTWMGTAHAVKCAMSAIKLSFDDHGFLFTDDQWVFANAFIQSAKTQNPIIALDYHANVFGSLYDRLQGGFSSFRPNDWECVEGRGWVHKPTGGVPKLYHASGNQGQPWMQHVILPYALRSGALGRPASCSSTDASGAQAASNNAHKRAAPAPGESLNASDDNNSQAEALDAQQQQQQSLPPPSSHLRASPRRATGFDLTLQCCIAGFGLGSFLLTAALARHGTAAAARRKKVAASRRPHSPLLARAV